MIQVGIAPVALATLFYVVMLRPWRPRRMLARSAPAVDLLFAGAALLACLAVLEPAPFERAAVPLVDLTGLPDSLADLDRRIDSVESLPDRMWADLTARLGWGQSDPLPPDAEPLPGDRYISDAVLPAVHDLVAIGMRGTVWLGCLVVLVIAQVMRGLAGLRRREAPAPALRAFDRQLDDRVAALEEALHTLTASAADPRPGV